MKIAVSSLVFLSAMFYILTSLYHPHAGQPLIKAASRMYLDSLVYYMLPLYPLDGGNIFIAIAELIRKKPLGTNIMDTPIFNSTVFLVILMLP